MTDILGEALEFEMGNPAIFVAADLALASGVEVTAHHYDHVGDTSWILLKIPRSRYRLSFHNCSGDDTDSPTTKTSNPKAWLEGHPDFLLAHNCNCGGTENLPGEWGSRWNGTEYPKLNAGSRDFFAFDSETGDCAFYPAGTYDSEDLFAAVPEKYDIIFGCGNYLVMNGETRTEAFDLDNDRGSPRTAFGWDDDFYYVLSAEGRGTYERGLTLDEVKDIFVAHGVANAVNFDGGGSVCLAARIGGVEKINRFRDCSLPYPQLRAVGLCAAYERRGTV